MLKEKLSRYGYLKEDSEEQVWPITATVTVREESVERVDEKIAEMGIEIDEDNTYHVGIVGTYLGVPNCWCRMSERTDLCDAIDIAKKNGYDFTFNLDRKEWEEATVCVHKVGYFDEKFFEIKLA